MTARDSADNHWKDLHDHFAAEAKDKEADVIFIGDDHIALLEQSTYFRSNIAPLHCLVFGSLGDNIDNVRWRVENGELSNISPKVIVLSVGLNETGTSSEFLSSTASLAQLIHQNQPTSKLFVMKLLPRGKKTNPRRDFVNEVNAKLEDTIKEYGSTIDVDPSIISADGHIEPHMMFDFLHLTQEGYSRVFEYVQIAVSSALNL